MTRVCLYVVGDPPPELARETGTFTQRFAELTRPLGVELVAVDGRETTANPSDFAGAIVTGSPASLTAPESWMDDAIEFTRGCYRVGTPLLGVCFGHQLIGAAAGAPVVNNPDGWEISSWPVTVNAHGQNDLLFAGLDETIHVNFSHQDVIDISLLPDSVRVLADNPKTKAQAIAWGAHVRGVQFHPEFSGSVMQRYIALRSEVLAADAESRGAHHEMPDELSRRARDCPDGVRVLHNFVEHFILRPR